MSLIPLHSRTFERSFCEFFRYPPPTEHLFTLDNKWALRRRPAPYRNEVSVPQGRNGHVETLLLSPAPPNFGLEGVHFADHRSRQQHRSGAEGAQEEDATRGHLPRDETQGTLRKTERKACPRAGRGNPPLSQAATQAPATRRPDSALTAQPIQ